ncbi:hypothetical protein EDD11_003752 [Mortierella claussenii]|nr:hypothetical protein EDD11_003752 [Mortierella claussenii]
MSSILNVLRSAPTPTRHFTSLNIVSSTGRSQSAAAAATGFNPEHHPIVLQQLVESLSPAAYVSSSSSASASAAARDSLSGKTVDAIASRHEPKV